MSMTFIVSVIAMLIVFEGAIVAFNPKWTRSVTRKIFKNLNTIRIIGIIELIIGLVLLFFALVY